MSDELRREIQARLDELLGEADKLRRALAALGSADRAAPPSASATPSAARERVRPRAGSAPASRSATRKPARRRPSASTAATSPSPQAAERPVARAARPAARPAPGATRHAVLAALAGGTAMTAGDIASATGLGGASVTATLSQLARVGEVTKAVRGYQIAGAEPAQRFYFRTEGDAPTGAVAANLPELEAVLAVCEQGVLRHHCPGHDFSGWVAGVFDDEPLAARIAAAEAQLSADSPTAVVEQVRRALIAALQARHATQG